MNERYAERGEGEWLGKGLNPVRIAVNISQSELAQINFFDRIISFLKTFELGPEAIQIELTEVALVLSDAHSIAVLQQLRSGGISVALDAFGRGLLSLDSLDGLPVDTIKLDKLLLRRLAEAGGPTDMVYASIAAAHALRMTVIAEGIETEEQMWVVRRIGCDVLQGFHIALPVNAIAAGEVLAERLKTRQSVRDWVPYR